jgi:hypothetical protein
MGRACGTRAEKRNFVKETFLDYVLSLPYFITIT